MELKQYIREIPNFPKEGISFKDVTTLIKEKDVFKYVIDKIAQNLKDKKIDYIVGPEARGFIVGAPVSYAIGAGFVPIRKKGKLPGQTLSKTYQLEYGEDTIEIHSDAIPKGSRVAIVDDLIATGGTVNAIIDIIESLGSEVVSLQFIIELTALNTSENIKKYDMGVLVQYDDEE